MVLNKEDAMDRIKGKDWNRFTVRTRHKNLFLTHEVEITFNGYHKDMPTEDRKDFNRRALQEEIKPRAKTLRRKKQAVWFGRNYSENWIEDFLLNSVSNRRLPKGSDTIIIREEFFVGCVKGEKTRSESHFNSLGDR